MIIERLEAARNDAAKLIASKVFGKCLNISP